MLYIICTGCGDIFNKRNYNISGNKVKSLLTATTSSWRVITLVQAFTMDSLEKLLSATMIFHGLTSFCNKFGAGEGGGWMSYVNKETIIPLGPPAQASSFWSRPMAGPRPGPPHLGPSLPAGWRRQARSLNSTRMLLFHRVTRT